MLSTKRIRKMFGLLGLAFGAFGAVRDLREAKDKRDGLALTHALINFAAVVTGAALAVRAWRAGDEEE